MANLSNTLTGWKDGPPPVRTDQGMAIVLLRNGVIIDGVETIGRPVIVARRSWGLEGVAHIQICRYEDVLRHIDIAFPPDE